jgi:hypothetical protein
VPKVLGNGLQLWKVKAGLDGRRPEITPSTLQAFAEAVSTFPEIEHPVVVLTDGDFYILGRARGTEEDAKMAVWNAFIVGFLKAWPKDHYTRKYTLEVEPWQGTHA